MAELISDRIPETDAKDTVLEIPSLILKSASCNIWHFKVASYNIRRDAFYLAKAASDEKKMDPVNYHHTSTSAPSDFLTTGQCQMLSVCFIIGGWGLCQ